MCTVLSIAQGDRRCLAFSATSVSSGQGLGIVVATGDSAEIGRISQMVSQVGVVVDGGWMREGRGRVAGVGSVMVMVDEIERSWAVSSSKHTPPTLPLCVAYTPRLTANATCTLQSKTSVPPD